MQESPNNWLSHMAQS